MLPLVGCVLSYAVLGALVETRAVSSLIATLGASFIWLGLGLFALPIPGGQVPDWLINYTMGRPCRYVGGAAGLPYILYQTS